MILQAIIASITLQDIFNVANFNRFGLICGIVGALLLLRFGIPNKIDPEGHQALILEQDDEDEKKRARTYKKLSNIGLGLICVGFAFQFIATFLT